MLISAVLDAGGDLYLRVKLKILRTTKSEIEARIVSIAPIAAGATQVARNVVEVPTTTAQNAK